MKRVLDFIRREMILSIAAVCALISVLFVPPDGEYWGYIDFRVLGLLFCLMAVVLGFESCGIFDRLARTLLRRCRSLYAVALALVLLPFFTSMIVTNDVALITFVPLALLVLRLLGQSSRAVLVIVLQTVAANLGSMATPVGNPQNLFLFGHYGFTPGSFFATVLPYALISLAVLIPACLLVGRGPVRVTMESAAQADRPWRLWIYGGLFLLCLLSVFHAVHYAAVTAAVLLVMLLLDRPLLKRVDYLLLVTFVCFFIFAGNLGRIPQVRTLLTGLLARDPLLCSAAASQIISNVPAAVLLSGFTDQGQQLLLGVNIGGLGTPIASLASLISMKLYARSPGARTGRFLAVFLAVNGLGLALLLLCARLL